MNTLEQLRRSRSRSAVKHEPRILQVQKVPRGRDSHLSLDVNPLRPDFLERIEHAISAFVGGKLYGLKNFDEYAVDIGAASAASATEENGTCDSGFGFRKQNCASC